MKLGDLAASVEWPFGLVLDADATKKLAVAASRHYDGWGQLRSLAVDSPPVLSPDIDVTDGEWSIIKPLYMLYVERENARALEASRGLGVDVFGRTISEIATEISQYETVDLPRLAFSCQPESI